MLCRIRRAHYEDVDKIFSIMEEAASVIENPEYFVSGDLRYVIDHIELKGTMYLVVTEKEEIVGYLIVDIPGEQENNLGNDIGIPKENLTDVAQMDVAIVVPEYRGKGLQKKLLQHAEAVLRETGIKYLMATVHPGNIPSLRSLITSGYVIKETKLKYGGYLRHVMFKEIRE